MTTSASSPVDGSTLTSRPIVESIYRANLEVFGPPLAKSLLEHPAKPSAVDMDVRIQGLKNPQYLVIVGFTTHRVLEQVLRSNKDISYIMIVEPDMGIFHATMQREFLRSYVEDPRIDFLLGSNCDEAIHQMYQIFTRADSKTGSRASRCQSPEILFDPFRGFTEEDRKKWCDAISAASKQTFLAMGCGPDTFYRWERVIQNQDNIFDAYQGKSLFTKFQNTPAIVLGGGPSLNDFIEAYKKYDLGNKCMIVACDAVLKKLIDAGITPHFVTRAERKFTHIFSGVTEEYTKDTYFVPFPWVAPEYYEMFPNILAVTRGNGIGVWCKFNGMDPGEVNGGVSAANCAMELAVLFGCKNIILSGVDLCFLDDKSHVDGTEVEFDPEKSRPKWTQIPGNSGDVTSIPIWTRCLTEYEASIARHEPGTRMFYNTSVRGAKIAGTVVKPWSELSLLFGVTRDILKEVKAEATKHSDADRSKFKQAVKDTVVYLKTVKKDLNKLILNLEDERLLAGREEQRIVHGLNAFKEPNEYFNHLEACKKSLSEAFNEPCRKIDVWKNIWLKQDQFRYIMLDTLQSDHFQLENKIASLINLVPTEHTRKKMYIALHYNFFMTLDLYLDRMIDLFENGPNMETELTQIKESHHRLVNNPNQEEIITLLKDVQNNE